MQVIVKKYDGYNRALGKHITSKRHYNDEMKRQGMVSFEKGQAMADKAQEKMHKDYKLKDETRRFLKNINKTKDGKVNLSGREMAYMKKVGVDFRKPKERPLEGGWE